MRTFLSSVTSVITTDIQAYRNKHIEISSQLEDFVPSFILSQLSADTHQYYCFDFSWPMLIYTREGSSSTDSKITTSSSYCIVIVPEITAKRYISTQPKGPSVVSAAYSLPPPLQRQFRSGPLSPSCFTGKLNLQYSHHRSCSQNLSYTQNA